MFIPEVLMCAWTSFWSSQIKTYKPGTVKMPDGKETNWEDGKSLDSGDQPVIQPQMFEKMRHSENTKQQSLIQKYLTGWPLVGNEGMNPHHSYVWFHSLIPY